jgi:hypothetical protein
MEGYLKEIMPKKGERFICTDDCKDFNIKLTKEEFENNFYANIRSDNIDFGEKEYNDPNKRIECLKRMKNHLLQSLQYEKNKLTLSYQEKVDVIQYQMDKLQSEIFLLNHELKAKPMLLEEPEAPSQEFPSDP